MLGFTFRTLHFFFLHPQLWIVLKRFVSFSSLRSILTGNTSSFACLKYNARCSVVQAKRHRLILPLLSTAHHLTPLVFIAFSLLVSLSSPRKSLKQRRKKKKQKQRS
ncbi:hypothetical protein VNO77_43300 [Canavalia gladiata]|uniref:Uncharacterized protein n=1 Tax=Canavalia gladiata TaxID=3824 RepID=A0AAN9JTZ1_CANGL